MNYRYFIGIDTSKSHLDYCLFDKTHKVAQGKITNDPIGLQTLEKLLKSLEGLGKDHLLFCLEHGGIYNHHLLSWLASQGYMVWLENPLAIKRSLGIQRGKNDQVDAQRIAQYAARFADKAQLWQAPREVIEKLKGLVRLRERLLNAKNQLEVPLKESSMFIAQSKQKALSSHCQAALKGLKQSLDQIEQAIKELIKQDQQLKELYRVVSSVVGVGKITALELIIVSNEFKGIKRAKRCACYAGVAPFEHSSGSSIRGRSRVSMLANKRLKSLLHMAGLAAVRVGGELRRYYQRKVKEGKNKMLVLNAVRNKLLARIYACVQGMRAYSRTYEVGKA